jgi:hypothetical protein
MIVEIVELDGLCHWKMQCEHGLTECHWEEGHDGPHENEDLCAQMRRDAK